MPQRIPLIERYAAYLPVSPSTPRLSLGEGDTPLVRAPSLESETGVAEVWLKVEGANPTGSFKDRGMVLAVAKAMEEGAAAVMCASTGNTAASAAAYAARARLRCVVVLPGGQVALGKLSQAIAFGASVIAVRGSFDDALRVVREIAESGEVASSVNPYRLEGQKTAAFEICEALGEAPDALCIPVGNAGNITAYWKGFREAAAAGLASRTPRMLGFQAEGAAPIVRGAIVERPETIATAIRIGNPASWRAAITARDESGGAIEAVTDADILDAYRLLASCEGVFCEPASAAAVAGLRLRARAGGLKGIDRVVCVLTGNGLKDPESAMRLAPELREVEASADAGRRLPIMTTSFQASLRVRLPATSANLGPGFDSFGVALPLLAEFELRPARSWSVSVEGDGEGVPTGEDNLFIVAARATASAARATLPAHHLTQRSAIPLARGLGSSAAAIVGGCVAANAVLGEPLDRRTLLRVACEVEGHADNVAAALYGAFTLAVPTDHGPAATRLPFPSVWRVCLFIPSESLSTEQARGILPSSVTRADAVFNLSHAAALVAALLRADGALLSLAMQDRLHQPARLRLVPALDDIVAAARGAGAFGAALSGAGPSVLAVAPARLAPRVIAAMEDAAAAAGAGGRGRVLRVRAAGATVHRA